MTTLTENNNIITTRQEIKLTLPIAQLFEVLENFPDIPQILINSLTSFNYLLSSNLKIKNKISELDKISDLLKPMLQYKNNQKIQLLSCELVSKLSNDHTKNIQSIAQEGGIEAVFEALKKYPTDTHIQAEGCLALAHLAYTPENQTKITTTYHGIDYIISVLQRFTNNETIQNNCCLAFANFSFQNSENQEIMSGEPVNQVISIMKQYPESKNIHLNGTTALVNLSISTSNQNRITFLKGIPLIISSLTKFQTEALIVQKSFVALANLAYNNTRNQQEISQHVSLIENIMKNSSDLIIQEKAFLLLSNIAVNKNSKSQIVNSNLIEFAVNAIDTFRSENNILNYCLLFLANLAYNENQIQQKIASLSGLTKVLDLMSTCNNYDLECMSCLFLVNLSVHPFNKKIIADSNGIEQFLALMQKHPNDPQIQNKCILALANLSVAKENQTKIRELGVDIIFTLKDNIAFQSNLAIQTKLLILLVNLSYQNEENKKIFISRNVLGWIRDLMDRYTQPETDLRIQINCCKMISNVANYLDVPTIISVLSTMKKFSDPLIQDISSFILEFYVLKKTNPNETICLDILKSTLNTLQEYPNYEGIQEKSCSILEYFSKENQNPDYRILIRNQAITSLFNSAIRFSTNPIIFRSSFLTIVYCAKFIPVTIDSLLTEKQINTAKEIFSDSKIIQEHQDLLSLAQFLFDGQ
eukprot:Anaeramoba_ignava/a480755_244.p1 GENE.a480755_244~~a480755_244.p1  ORF type:complete len:700 (-),score=258.59 a480755_244:210-2309(-)